MHSLMLTRLEQYESIQQTMLDKFASVMDE
jgi:hypothetical protein